MNDADVRPMTDPGSFVLDWSNNRANFGVRPQDIWRRRRRKKKIIDVLHVCAPYRHCAAGMRDDASRYYWTVLSRTPYAQNGWLYEPYSVHSVLVLSQEASHRPIENELNERA